PRASPEQTGVRHAEVYRLDRSASPQIVWRRRGATGDAPRSSAAPGRAQSPGMAIMAQLGLRPRSEARRRAREPRSRGDEVPFEAVEAALPTAIVRVADALVGDLLVHDDHL